MNIHRLPPEILGEIFLWNIKHMFKNMFPRFGKRHSYNFMLVCRHWFNVAWHTPRLWSFWGRTLEGWTRGYPRSAGAPVDLVLEDSEYGEDDDLERCEYFDATLSDLLRDRANLNIIRRVYLISGNTRLLNTITSSLTPDAEQIRSNRMESFTLQHLDSFPAVVDLSDFFARHSFPRLRYLEIHGCRFSPWAHLAMQTGALTDLNLAIDHTSSPLSVTNTLLLFASNPLLRTIQISGRTIPEDKNPTFPFRVPLHHLTHLELIGDLQPIFSILRQLDYSLTLDLLSLTLRGRTIADIPQIVGPYLQDHFKRCVRSQSGLKIVLFCGHTITLDVEGVNTRPSTVGAERRVILTFQQDWQNPQGPIEVPSELIKHIPLEEVIYFEMDGPAGVLPDAFTKLTNLKTLRLGDVYLPGMFPEYNASIPPSLRDLIFDCSRVDDGDWSPLTTFLAGRVSSGTPLTTLSIYESGDMSAEVQGIIKGMVQEFNFPDQEPLL